MAASEPAAHAIHSITFNVADSDIDELGHASNIAYVRWLQETAVDHSNAVGLTLDAYRRIGGVFYVRRHDIEYLRPLLRGERVEVRTWIGSSMAAQTDRMTEIRNAEGAVAARATTTFAYVDIATGRPTRIPAEIRAAFGMPPR